jgi:membrane protease YdiL (CAAX protease family)
MPLPSKQGLVTALTVLALLVLGNIVVLLLVALPLVVMKINLRVDPTTVWFPIPALAVALVIVYFCRWRSSEAEPIRWPRRLEAAVVAIAAPILIGIVGIMVTGFDAIETGRVTLKGDGISPSPLFQYYYSLFFGLTGGMAEEAATRGIVQRSLVSRLGLWGAQWATTFAFCVAHLSLGVEPRNIIFVAVLAVTCGVMSVRYKSVALPALVHGIGNMWVPLLVIGARVDGA